MLFLETLVRSVFSFSHMGVPCGESMKMTSRTIPDHVTLYGV